MKKILVTGGAGYIGSHTVVALMEAGFEPVIIDNLSNSEESALDGIAEITGRKPVFSNFDLCDSEKVNDFFEQEKDLVGVIHFAAFKKVGESVEEPLKYYHNNIESLVNILGAMKKYQVPHLVFSSSCTVYGQPEKLPVTEKSPILKANCPYGNTKQINEEVIQDFLAVNSELSGIALRYFNPIGAHNSALIGELPLGKPDNLIPFVTQSATGKRGQIQVFGDDYNTPDGSAVRDYIHVMDLAEAHVRAINFLIDKESEQNFEVFNLGTGRGVSVLEILRTFEEVNDLKLDYKIVDRRPGDIEQIWADNTKAQNVLKWEAKKTLAQALKSAWEWEINLTNNK